MITWKQSSRYGVALFPADDVGSQPFSSEGFSGTGPKAGGPHYLPRFCAERVTSTDTTSSGGNATLLSLEDVGL